MMKTDLKIITTSWHENQHILSKLRNKVFVEEQGVPEELEQDEQDPSALHFLAYIEPQHKAIATARLLNDGHVGRMAVLKAYRNQSVGKKILDAIIEIAKQKKLAELFLNAQIDAQGFYEKSGFVRQGDIFMDAGIQHIRMIKKLT